LIVELLCFFCECKIKITIKQFSNQTIFQLFSNKKGEINFTLIPPFKYYLCLAAVVLFSTSSATAAARAAAFRATATTAWLVA